MIKFTVLPFSGVGAFCDVDTHEVFISERFATNPVGYNIAHELAHIQSGDPDHGNRFRQRLSEFGYRCQGNDIFARLRRRCGIPLSIGANIGNISGIQNMLLDYHLLQAYRKSSAKILGTYGTWEVINEVDGDASQQLIRLYPTPKGAFPVLVLYIPVVSQFRSPSAKQLANDMLLAEAKVMVGHARRKIAQFPAPGGGQIGLDGEALVQEGKEEKKECLEKAIKLGDPLGVYVW